MTSVSLSGVSKNYGAMRALETVDLTTVQGELLSLLGPSGCGKTTLLRLIAGLLEPTAGKVLFDDAVMNTVPPHKRNVGLVFQNYSLFPHMTVSQNVAFGLRMRGVDAKTIKAESQRILEMVRLPTQGNRYPWQLSGGQQQRVGLARALVIRPAVLLLDEPFGALDKKLRESMQLELRQLQQALKVTSIFVTHDQEEALTISDRIAVMNNGRVEQVDVPRVLYEAPATRFVLDFVGASNSFQGKVVGLDGSGLVVKTVEGGVVKSSTAPAGIAIGDDVLVACRPEKAWLAAEEDVGDAVNCFPGVVKVPMYLGSVTHYYIDGPGGKELLAYHLNAHGARAERTFQAGEHVRLCWNAENTLVFKA
jgi:putative spermidine/putrescine transport system ATP-binding protein